MKLFHGSYTEIQNPDLQHSRRNVDFGAGFYVTPIYEQAVKWSLRFLSYDKQAIVSTYDFDESSFSSLRVREFKAYSQEWLDFVTGCRMGKDTYEYDLIIGGAASDKIFNTMELFFDGLIDKGEAIKRLQCEKPNLQYCFKTQRVIDKYLKWERKCSCMNANPVLLQKKYAKVILLYADTYGIPVSEALGEFYRSKLYELLKEGASDLHCMSEAYLAEELHNEISNKKVEDKEDKNDL